MIVKINDNLVRQNSIKAWFLAARPKTLTAAGMPVMLATAMAWKTCDINWIAVVLCFLFAFLMQIDANFVNDYFDCVRGNDDETRLGPKRACAMGWISLPAMRIALVITTVLSCIAGLPLIYYGGWEMILVGAACVVFCFLYTTCLSYWGLGDLLVLIFFGIVPTYCSWYVMVSPITHHLTPITQHPTPINWQVFAVSVAVGLVIDTLLIINNFRDIDNDKKSGKRTIAVFIGRKAMSQVYLCIQPVAIIIMLICFPNTIMYGLMFIAFILHVNTHRRMVHIWQGRELNKILGLTARNIFLFGVLATVGIICT